MSWHKLTFLCDIERWYDKCRDPSCHGASLRCTVMLSVVVPSSFALCYSECHYPLCYSASLLSTVMLSVIMLSVVMLSVVAPFYFALLAIEMKKRF